MIVPTNQEVLAVVLHTLKSIIQPALSDKQARSAAQTAGHLLRFVSLRMDKEGAMLFEECRTLRTVLAAHRGYFATLEPDAEAARQAARLDEVLAKTYRDPGAYLSVQMLAQEVSDLREALYANHRYLISLRDARANDPRYSSIREEIRQFIIRDIRDEALVVDAGFDGFGPRR